MHQSQRGDGARALDCSCLRIPFEPEFGEREIDAITSDEIDHFQQKLLAAKPKSIQNRMWILNGTSVYAVKRGLREDEPGSGRR